MTLLGMTSQDRFSHKHNVKMGLFLTKEKVFLYLRNICKRQWQTNDNLWGRHLLLKCRRVNWIIHLQCPKIQMAVQESLKISWKIKHWNLARQRPLLLLQNPLTAHKYPHNSLSRCCCSLLVPINVLKHLHVSFSQSKSLSQLQNRHSPFLWVWLMFLNFFKGTLLVNINKMANLVLLIVGFEQLDDIFRVTGWNLCTWLNTVYWVWGLTT